MSTKLENVRKTLSKVEELPTLPTVVTQLMSLTENPLTTANDINNVIKTDQALTAKTLKLVNSAYYGFPRSIGTVTQAVVILGFNTVKSLAIGATVCKIFDGGSEKFDRKRLWEHSIAVGFAARILAKHVKYQDEEEAFVCGILHDIAKIVEDQKFHDDFIKAVLESKEKTIDLSELEKKHIGMDHSAIGKRIANIWNLPVNVTKAIGFHHNPRFAGEYKRLASIVHIADAVVKIRKIGDSGNHGKVDLDKEVTKELGIDKKALTIIVKKLLAELKKADEFLKIIKE